MQNAILDGEVVCLDGNGVSQFTELMSRKGKPIFYAVDLLWFDGEDLRKLPLIERKGLLHELIRQSGCEALFRLATMPSKSRAQISAKNPTP